MFRLVTRKDVDMIVVQSRCSDHEPVRMECGSSNGSRAVAKEPRVWLKVRYGPAGVDVEDLDAMLLCSTTIVSIR
jgi:hypothetical protein